jgi:hypothetical protein
MQEALLCNPEIALYFCGAYLIWLSSTHPTTNPCIRNPPRSCREAS